MIESTLSHYRITAKLGEGGMGVVYEAEDETLKRRVALKLLPPEMAADPDRLERFRREAEAVAALSHPNIVSIHSIEESDGLHFLTMELVKGEGLDTVVRRGGLTLRRVLEIGESIASALATAHDRGVVHRDIKPANVMLMNDGLVKVLDFGLAKLMVDPESPDEPGTQLVTEPALTGAGAILGTVSYMSPEQARGHSADHRADIFALGCVLYEASTGALPFPGESSVDTLYQIIHTDPRPVDELIPSAPPQLQWILRKALAKEPAARYQSARELALDLKTLRRDLDSGVARPSVPSDNSAETPHPNSGTRRWLMGSVLVAFVALSGTWWFRGRAPRGVHDPSPPAAAISVRPITSSGKVTCAALSPDGNYVAYVESDRDEQGLNLRQLKGTQNLELIAPRRVGYWGLTFTRDGSAIVFGEKSAEEPTGAFFRISTLGGRAKRLLAGIDSQPTFSPDDARMAWVRAKFPAPGESSLMVARIDGTGARALVTLREPDRFAPIFHTAPSWSPDGVVIATAVETVGEKTVLKAFDVETGQEVWTGSQEWEWASRVAWLPQGEGILAIAYEKTTPEARLGSFAAHQVWSVPYPRGSPVRLTNDSRTYRVLSPSADGSALVTVAVGARADISVMPRNGSGPLRKISHSRLDGRFGFDFAADGRIVYQTLDGETMQIGIMNADGSEPRLLTDSKGDKLSPLVAPEDLIIYFSNMGQASEIRAMELDGSNSRLLATALPGRGATLSPDGKWVVYEAQESGSKTLWRVPLEGGAPERLTDYEAGPGAVSPDGTRIAFYYRDSTTGSAGLGVMPFAPGEPELRLPSASRFTGSFLRWTADGQALLINTVPGDRANLWRVPLDGRERERLTDFEDQTLFWFGFSPDGETLALARGELLRDAMLIEGLR